MTLTLRKNKGAPLTSEEADNNLLYLEEQIKKLAQDTFVPEKFQNITLENNTLTLKGSSGSIFGPYPINTTPHMRGMWAPKTSYTKGDFTQNENALYMAQQNHISGDTFDHENWSVCFKTESTSSEQQRQKIFPITQLPAKEHDALILVITEDNKIKPAYFDGKNWCYVSNDQVIQKGGNK